MRAVTVVLSLILIFLALWDVFETVVLPRRVSRPFRFARIFYLSTWGPWKAVGRRIPVGRGREDFLSIYGPLSMLSLLALWAALLLLGFALLQWGLHTSLARPEEERWFTSYLYLSGASLFTVGPGDTTPVNTLGSALMIVEAGTGFGVLALVIGYLPVLYQSFARREANISLLDARAGSPPSAAEILKRYSDTPGRLEGLFERWEDWAGQLLESHMTLPVLCFYRSQHQNQSWVGSLTTILDAAALVLTVTDGVPKEQAQFAFAMARHAVVDLAHVFNVSPRTPRDDRLPREEFARLYGGLREEGLALLEPATAEGELGRVRELYEPYCNALAGLLLVPLPPWNAPPDEVDNWRKSAWQKREPVAIKHSTAESEGGAKRLG
jgi:Ion channel